ncbi:MAG: glycosyltransferase family 2 protein [Bacteroidales bacterium]|nr:glycosyltransferase family 2 protein [Bacteroidales bacterium]
MIDGVSLIICTYNGSKLLPLTIKHILDQETDLRIHWEVLFINNASTDDTNDVILNCWKSKIPMRIINEDKQGVIYARQRGLVEAKYDIVSFIDDDNWINDNWIEEVYSTFLNNPLITICGSKNKAKYEINPPECLSWIEESFAIGSQGESFEDITIKRGYVWTAGLSLRKDVYFSLIEKGFSFFLTGRKGKKLSAGEDTELCYAFILSGYQIWYNERMTLTHFIPAQRLQWTRIIQLFEGFGKAHSVLQIYKLFIDNKNSILILFYNNIKDYSKFFIQRLLGQIKNNEGNGKYLHYLFIKERFISTVFNYNFINNYFSINKFRKSVSKMKK